MTHSISARELKSRLDKNEALNLIDVREEWEFEEINIGARLHPLPSLPHCLDKLAHLKNEEIILHCKSGDRSNRARKYLISQGFTNVKTLEGGIQEYLSL